MTERRFCRGTQAMKSPLSMRIPCATLVVLVPALLICSYHQVLRTSALVFLNELAAHRRNFALYTASCLQGHRLEDTKQASAANVCVGVEGVGICCEGREQVYPSYGYLLVELFFLQQRHGWVLTRQAPTLLDGWHRYRPCQLFVW